MSQYTVELRTIINSLPEGETIFTGIVYPIFSEAHREVLESKIINHYYHREIGFETYGRFKFMLASTMQEIMPKMNKLYEVLEIPVDIITSMKNVRSETSESELTNKQTSTGASNTTANGVEDKLFSDTPQGKVNPFASGYATSANKDTSNLTGAETSSGALDGESEARTTISVSESGYFRKTPWEIIAEYRQNLFCVDELIIKQLADLFLKLY